MQEDANAQSIAELPPPPEPPMPGECCGRGCENCVWVYYERARARWEEKVAAIKAATGTAASVI